jgi:hypothetical protein
MVPVSRYGFASFLGNELHIGKLETLGVFDELTEIVINYMHSSSAKRKERSIKLNELYQSLLRAATRAGRLKTYVSREHVLLWVLGNDTPRSLSRKSPAHSQPCPSEQRQAIQAYGDCYSI